MGLSYGGVIRDCFSLGNVSAGSYSGGFAGRSVYSGNTYLNCYCAGSVTVTGEQGHGFIGGSRPDSAFQPDLASEISNCYYNAATLDDSYAAGKSLSQMQSAEFLIQLNNGGAVWLQSADKNGGMPYLAGVQSPEGTPTSEITVELAVAIYDKTSYSFSQMGQTVSITMPSNGNTRVIDLLDAAVSQGKLSYYYETTSSFGRYIHTINGYAVEEPDGWMFSVNDKLSNVSASLATVTDGDRLLWFEGTTENRFQGPSWDSLSGEELQWIEITSVQQLMDLASSTDKAKLAENYRLGQNLDFQGAVFAGIGTQAHPFTGRFDGQGHTISNFTVSGTENTGFFGVIKGAIIQNLHLSGVTVTGGKRVGGLVGWAQAELDSEDMGILSHRLSPARKYGRGSRWQTG